MILRTVAVVSGPLRSVTNRYGGIRVITLETPKGPYLRASYGMWLRVESPASDLPYPSVMPPALKLSDRENQCSVSMAIDRPLPRDLAEAIRRSTSSGVRCSLDRISLFLRRGGGTFPFRGTGAAPFLPLKRTTLLDSAMSTLP